MMVLLRLGKTRQQIKYFQFVHVGKGNNEIDALFFSMSIRVQKSRDVMCCCVLRTHKLDTIKYIDGASLFLPGRMCA